jgi:cellobiose phosphorylase
VIPDWWEGFKAQLRHGEAIYIIEVENPDHLQKGVARVEMDGKRLDTNSILLDHEPLKHIIRVRIG